MRWQPRLAEHPALKACKVELLYMDTTYCLPKHVFPSQDTAIATLVKVMREAHAEERKTLFVVGSYHIGKERAFFGAARALGFRVWCHAGKKQVLLPMLCVLVKQVGCIPLALTCIPLHQCKCGLAFKVCCLGWKLDCDPYSVSPKPPVRHYLL